MSVPEFGDLMYVSKADAVVVLGQSGRSFHWSDWKSPLKDSVSCLAGDMLILLLDGDYAGLCGGTNPAYLTVSREESEDS